MTSLPATGSPTRDPTIGTEDHMIAMQEDPELNKQKAAWTDWRMAP